MVDLGLRQQWARQEAQRARQDDDPAATPGRCGHAEQRRSLDVSKPPLEILHQDRRLHFAEPRPPRPPGGAAGRKGIAAWRDDTDDCPTSQAAPQPPPSDPGMGHM